MHAMVPDVATLGAAALISLVAARSMTRIQPSVPLAAMASWAAGEPPRARPDLRVTRFESARPARPPKEPEAQVLVRLDRLREALDQLTGLLLIGTAGSEGQARFLAALEGGERPIDREVAAAALAMRRLGTLMLSGEREAFLVARSAVGRRADAQGDVRAIWEDFLAALAFLTGACQRCSSTIHLEELEATAGCIEQLCQAISRTELLVVRLRAGSVHQGY